MEPCHLALRTAPGVGGVLAVDEEKVGGKGACCSASRRKSWAVGDPRAVPWTCARVTWQRDLADAIEGSGPKLGSLPGLSNHRHPSEQRPLRVGGSGRRGLAWWWSDEASGKHEKGCGLWAWQGQAGPADAPSKERASDLQPPGTEFGRSLNEVPVGSQPVGTLVGLWDPKQGPSWVPRISGLQHVR